MLFGIIIDLGGNPKREVIGFRYWVDPGPMGPWWDTVVGNTKLSRFVGLGSVLGRSPSSHMLHSRVNGTVIVSVGDECIHWNRTGRQSDIQQFLSLIHLRLRLV
jgi:hypothetical protein